MEKVLDPIYEEPADYERIESAIDRLWDEYLYAPLRDDLPKEKIDNSVDDLLSAIAKGTLRFHRGIFKGKISGRLSKALKDAGAKWDKKSGAWKIAKSALPKTIRDSINLSEERFLSTVRSLEKTLKKMSPSAIASHLHVAKMFDSTLFRLDKDIRKSLVVEPKLTPYRGEKISKEYEHNLQRYIQKFTGEEIVKLRKRIKKAALDGGRYEDLIEVIMRSRRVSRNKAHFLARQETSLMMAKYKEARYSEAGVEEYIWGCVAGSPNHPVRPMHKALEGKTFRWDSPPVTDEKGSRNHPGEDFNCRCFARPVVRF